MRAFHPEWVFDLWCDGAADCYNAEVMHEMKMWSTLRFWLTMAWGNIKMWLFGWWKRPTP